MAVRNRAQNSSNDLCSNPSNMIIRAHNFEPRCRILPVPRNSCSVVVHLYCCCNCDKQLFHRELHRPVKFSDSCLSMTIVYRLSIINLLVDGLTLHRMSKRPHNLDVSHAGCIDVISMSIPADTAHMVLTSVRALSYLLGFSIQVQVLKFGKLEILHKLLDWHSGCFV